MDRKDHPPARAGTLRMALALAGTALVGACVSAPDQPARPPASLPKPSRLPARLPAVRAPAPLPPARVLSAPGLEGIIGASPADLARLLGTPRLDVAEGEARKLQFVGPSCVLDAYLYPPRSGAEPRATYVETRRASDAQDVDRAACVASLRKR